MKNKNALVASIRIDGFPIRLMCRKTRKGYEWYSNDGSGIVNAQLPASPDLKDAKAALLTTFPPSRSEMWATWLT